MPEISLIIPVYNVEKYLRRCLDSVVNQTYKDFECILIDDGSTDMSGQICDEYADKDNRFIVIHQENGGVSSARNAGLDIAKGRYIAFCDSDDELLFNYLELMCTADESMDMVVLGLMSKSNDNIRNFIIFDDMEFFSIDNSVIQELISNRCLNTVFGKRFKKKIIEQKHISFDKSYSLGEDSIFVSEYLIYTNSLKYCSKTGYVYYTNNDANNSLSHFDELYTDKLLTANKKIVKILAGRFSEIEESKEWKNRMWKVYYESIFSILREPQFKPRKRVELIRKTLNNEDIDQFLEDIDYYMQNDKKIWTNLIKAKSSIGLVILWKISNR